MARKDKVFKVGMDGTNSRLINCKLGSNLDANSFKVVNLSNGSSSQDGATKTQLDAVTYTVSNGLQLSGGAISVKADSVGGTNLAKVVNVSSNGVAIKVDGTYLIESVGALTLSLPTSAIADGAIDNARLASGSVTSSKIAAGAIDNMNKFSGSLTGFGMTQIPVFAVDIQQFTYTTTFSNSGGFWTSDATYSYWTMPAANHGFSSHVYIQSISKSVSTTYEIWPSEIFSAYVDSSNNVVIKTLLANTFVGKITVGYS